MPDMPETAKTPPEEPQPQPEQKEADAQLEEQKSEPEEQKSETEEKKSETEDPAAKPEPEEQNPEEQPAESEEAAAKTKPEDAKTETTKPKKRKKKTAKDFAIEFLIKIVITVAAVIILCVFVVGIHVNHGNSSYPMIKDGDLVITYKLGKAQAGEEIAYRRDGKIKFGRIVAKAGDVVEISDSYLTVNGYGVLEDVVYPTTADGAVISFPYIVPEGSVFVLNDFRSDAGDSRTYGAIPLSDVEGEVILVLRRRGI
ncbi:MAG: signal peptidase I [Clostridiales bacterium]|nr:signal peptidase I [Clostridiales bacterium]